MSSENENEQKLQEKAPETPPKKDSEEKDQNEFEKSEEKKEETLKNSKESEKKETDEEIQAKYKKKTCMINGFVFMIPEHYELIKLIGYGAFGLVCSALNKEKNQYVAIKKISNIFSNLYEGKRILREVKLLKFFQNHKNIISLLDIIKPDSKNGYQDIFLVLELMNSDLEKIIKSKQVFTPLHIKHLLFQLLNGIYYLHSADIIHRDLKPNNLLVNSKCELKIADLGLAVKFDKKRVNITDYVVTRWYRAPEIILSNAEYTKAIDIWSAGCIFAEMMGRTPIFPGNHYLDQMDRIIAVLGTPQRDDLPITLDEKTWGYLQKNIVSKMSFSDLYPKIEPMAIDLLEKMLLYHPEKRYTAAQCLKHPYFDSINDKESMMVECKEVFDWSFDNVKYTKASLQEAIYDEAVSF